MSRPIKYIRHPWTHRSDFQKTRGYNTIRLEECTESGAKALARDSDDDLSDSERTCKRRRIEKLAESYVKGEPLFISSARPCPQALKRTVAWHKKSSTQPGYVVPEVNTSEESAPIWRDVEDDDHILERLVSASKLKQVSRRPDHEPLNPDDMPSELVEDIQYQASCKAQRRPRAAKVDVGPSEDALRQAAALRNRNARTKATEMTKVAEEATTAATPALDPGDCIIVTQSDKMLRMRQNKREWLSRRKSRFSFGGDDGNGGLRAASSPCIAPSSPPSTGNTPSQTRRPTSELSGEGISERFSKPNDAVSWVRANDQEELGSRDERSHTLSRRSGRSTDVATRGQSQGSRSGAHTDLHTRGKHSRSSQSKAQAYIPDPHQPLLPTFVDRAASERPLSSAATCLARTTTSQNTADANKHAYVQAPSTQNGTTPLMYRKRASRSKTLDPEDGAAIRPATRQSNRRRITFPSSEENQLNEQQEKDQQNVASHPPVLEMSFRPDYSFAPDLNMALVDEHVNRMLPAEEEASGRTTSTKKALRRELKNSGAEITRCDSEPPSSSHLEGAALAAPFDSHALDVAPLSTESKRSKKSDFERRQTWLGTQAMVVCAERDLFTSPGKHCGTFTPINEASALSHRLPAGEEWTKPQERAPLKHLSQEPAPSTQAMLETFGGFSTVKKPRGASAWDKRMDEGTPVAVEKGKRPDARLVSEHFRSSSGSSKASEKAKENGGSSLRFSISSFESAGVQKEINAPPSATAPDRMTEGVTSTSLAIPAPSSSSHRSAQLDNSALKPSAAAPPGAELTSHGRRSHTLFSQSQIESQLLSTPAAFPDLTSFHRAQDPNATSSAGVSLLRDPSDLDGTIEDLSRDVLGPGQGALSQ